MGMDAAILDMDGLMVDTEAMYQRAWVRAAGGLGYQLEPDVYLECVGRTLSHCEQVLIAQFGAEFPMPIFRQCWNQLWLDDAETHGIPKKPGIDALLDWLHRHEIPVAVATSSDRTFAEFSLRRAGLWGEFDHLVTADQVAQGKPAPDLFLEAASRLGMAPEQCVVFEDSAAGVQAATAANIPVCLVPDLKAPTEDIRALAWCVVPSLIEALNKISVPDKKLIIERPIAVLALHRAIVQPMV